MGIFETIQDNRILIAIAGLILLLINPTLTIIIFLLLIILTLYSKKSENSTNSYCSKCGTKFESDASFCSKCGHKITK